MSFYGNITSNNKTQFKFAKTYDTEADMRAAAAEDGVFVGGYVLVGNNTVWQKIQTADLQFKYVMIAELNSVVPTFDIITDAPTENPQEPYFDPDSTNMHYKLHMQPSWGLRVAEAGEGEPSDIMVDGKNLDIYFNKEGFSKNAISNEENYIVLTNAKSGQQYNGVEENDIKELSIHLPAIGNTVAEIHNLMYGENRQSGPDSLKGQLNFFTNADKEHPGLQENQIPIYTTIEKGLIGAYLEELTLTQLENENPNKDIIKQDATLGEALLLVNSTVNDINDNLDKLTEDLSTVNNKIVQADWNESDTEKESFIKNKPADMVTKKTTWEYYDDGHQFGTWPPESESFTLETLFVKVHRLEKYIRALADKIEGVNLDELDKEEEK